MGGLETVAFGLSHPGQELLLPAPLPRPILPPFWSPATFPCLSLAHHLLLPLVSLWLSKAGGRVRVRQPGAWIP